MATQFQQRIGAILLLCVFLASLGGCDLPLPPASRGNTATPLPEITPIAANFTPSRLLEACFDTYPLMSDALFRAAVNRVADMLESPGTITVNEGHIEVYISYIVGSNSYLKDAFSFSVPAMSADKEKPPLSPTPDAKAYPNQYDYVNAQATVTSANATSIAAWQAQLLNNHTILAAAKALVKQYAEKLRTLPNVRDASLEDVTGCLQAYSQRAQGFQGRKTLIIASPLVHMIDSSNGITLFGSHVEIIFKSCQLASSDECITQSSAWKQTFLRLGASQVTIFDPQQSLVKPLTF